LPAGRPFLIQYSKYAKKLDVIFDYSKVARQISKRLKFLRRFLMELKYQNGPSPMGITQ